VLNCQICTVLFRDRPNFGFVFGFGTESDSKGTFGSGFGFGGTHYNEFWFRPKLWVDLAPKLKLTLCWLSSLLVPLISRLVLSH